MTELLPGAHMREELNSQPETWARAADLRDAQALLPASGARIAVVGCGTSWFMAQSYAFLRETAGQGETDAFAASDDRDACPLRRQCSLRIAHVGGLRPGLRLRGELFAHVRAGQKFSHVGPSGPDVAGL